MRPIIAGKEVKALYERQRYSTGSFYLAGWYTVEELRSFLKEHDDLLNTSMKIDGNQSNASL